MRSSRSPSSSRSSSGPTSRTSSRSRSTTSRSATRCARRAAARAASPPLRRGAQPVRARGGQRRGRGADAGRSSRQRGEIDGARVVYRLELAPRERWELRLDVVASIDGDAVAPRTAERRFGDELTPRARLARRLAAARARSCAPTGTSSTARSASPSPTSRRCACAARDATGRTARGRDAVVHDRLRARHAHHVPADAALRSRARAHGARGARRAAGDGGRPVRSTPSRARSSTRCATARRPRTGSAPTTAPSTRRRSTSSCSRRSGAGPTTRPSCAS